MTNRFSISILLFVLILVGSSCKSQKERVQPTHDLHLRGAVNHHSGMPFDSNLLLAFYHTYPALERYQKDVRVVYRQHGYTHIWYDAKGIVEFGHTLYSKAKEIDKEGVESLFPYQEKIDGVFENTRDNTMTPTETEIMLTNLYLYYAEKVYKGLDDTTSSALGWLLPRKQVDYTMLLDSVMASPQLLERNDSVLFSQYYKLRDYLQKYREIEKAGGWKPVELPKGSKGLQVGDTGIAVLQVKERLLVTGDLKGDHGSRVFDEGLAAAVKNFQTRNGKIADGVVSPKLAAEMNVPVTGRIRQILVNMERCRWVSPEFARAREYIVVNIPSFYLMMVRNGKPVLESPVVVGKSVSKTVIFSGMLSYIVFSPYWNVPQSIINKEVKPGMKRNPNYLEAHNMEWNNGQVRQKPGKNNSLGQVKFIFPNSNDIYMHDTPAKSLFARESRAFSHGCIRVGKPRDLAITILADDPNWTPAKIDAAMNSGRENSYTLKQKIPVYISYLTAWVDPGGNINFYDDIYDRDGSLAALLFGSK